MTERGGKWRCCAPQVENNGGIVPGGIDEKGAESPRFSIHHGIDPTVDRSITEKVASHRVNEYEGPRPPTLTYTCAPSSSCEDKLASNVGGFPLANTYVCILLFWIRGVA